MAAKTFKDMLVWQEAYGLAIVIYSITKTFPKEEQYGLTNQLRRSAVSVASNIAEGFGRNSMREKDQFYSIAYGSLIEVENQLLIARGVGYIDNSTLKMLEVRYVLTQKLLSGLQRANKLRGKEAYDSKI